MKSLRFLIHLRARWAVAVIMGLAAVAGGCGLPESDQVEVLAQDDHRELLEGTTSTEVPVADPEDEEAPRVRLFFIGEDNKLESVIRSFREGSNKNDVLKALEAPPTAEEIAAYEGILQTFLLDGLAPRFGEPNRETGSQPILVEDVGLRQRVEDQTDTGRLIVRQIVCTVLSLNLDDVVGVEIYDGEEPIPLTDNAAQPIIGPAELEDFDNCTTGTEEREAQLEAETEEDGTTTTARTTVPAVGNPGDDRLGSSDGSA